MAALPVGMRLLRVQNPFTAKAVAIFLPYSFGLLLLLPGRVPPVLPAQPLRRQHRTRAPTTRPSALGKRRGFYWLFANGVGN